MLPTGDEKEECNSVMYAWISSVVVYAACREGVVRECNCFLLAAERERATPSQLQTSPKFGYCCRYTNLPQRWGTHFLFRPS